MTGGYMPGKNKEDESTTPTEDENFGAAFDEAAVKVETPDETINLEEEGEPPKPSAEETPAKVDEPAVVPPKEEAPVPETPVAEAPKPETPATDFNRLLAELNAKIEAQNQEIAELKKGPPKAAETPAAAVTPPVEEVDEDVKSFEEEYDYLAKPVKKIVDRMVKRAIATATPQGEPGPGIKEEDVQRLVADGVHFGLITARHKDFFDIHNSGELEKFAQTDPQLRKIYDEGTAEEVIGLVDQFKAHKNPPPVKPAEPVVDQEKDRKLHDLEAVRNRRGPINAAGSTGQAETYEDAFDEAAAKISK
jgi:hypothetical protein